MAASQLNRFDKFASVYDRLACFVFGDSLIRAQESNLDAVAAHADVLVLGGGTGKGLTQLLQRNKSCKIWFVETSQKMIDQAKKQLGFSNRIVFVHGTHENIPDQKFDIVITHFFVDMFTAHDLVALTEKIHGSLKSEGKWIVADFVNDKYWHSMLLKAMYLFFNLMGALDVNQLPDWDRTIQHEYFRGGEVSFFYRGFIKNVTFTKL